MGLDPLFSPRAVAVIGASNRKLTIGYRIIENLLDFGFRGQVYPVNPKGGEIRGLTAYHSILDTPEPVDVAHIVIKNTYVPACLEDCAKKGVKAVIVNTAGFREIGPEGVALDGYPRLWTELPGHHQHRRERPRLLQLYLYPPRPRTHLDRRPERRRRRGDPSANHRARRGRSTIRQQRQRL